MPSATVNYRSLPPVEENADRPAALSQSFLARADNCARSGYLYLTTRNPSSHAMDRGSCFHEFARRFVDLLVEREEATAPPEVAKDLLSAVIDEHPEWQLPHAELDALRVMAHHLAEGLLIEPDKVVATEKMYELELDSGHRIRGRVDFATIYPESHFALVRDYSTSFAIPAQGEFNKLFQTKLYGLMIVEGKGEGDAVGMGKDVDTVKVQETYPRYPGLPFREAIFTRQELRDFRSDVEAVVARAEHGFTTGEWPAVPGDHCSRCPAAHLCPLPSLLIPAVVNGDVLELAEREHWLTNEAKTIRKKIKAHAKEHGEPIPVGTDLEWGFKLVESEKVKDLQAVKGVIESGGFDLDEYITKSRSSRFEKRKVA